MEKKCLWCKKVWIRPDLPPSHFGRMRYCSGECAVKAVHEKQKKQIIKKCRVCKKDFSIKKSKKNLRFTCSHSCFGIEQARRISGSKNWNWKPPHERVLCGGYIQKRDKRYRSGYVYMHRWIMQQKIKRRLRPDEQVHHINGNRKDNRIENLQIMTRSEHTMYHKRKG